MIRAIAVAMYLLFLAGCAQDGMCVRKGAWIPRQARQGDLSAIGAVCCAR